jgi:hypothetical protein
MAFSASLPFSTVFKGQAKFDQLLAKARAENWAALPIGQRVAKVGSALVGTPYQNYTLEIDDKIEAPSVNFVGLDCWTFFETSLAFARMLTLDEKDQNPANLLKLIETDRYRNGRCEGYLSRLHFLEDWMYDNKKRGLVVDITGSLGGVRMPYRNIQEMTVAWKSYRYLRNSPNLRSGMDVVEERVSALPVYHVPKAKVAGIESKIQSGDIICITCADKGSYSSHVGLAYRDSSGVLRFMHATPTKSKGHQVVIDDRLSVYLAGKSGQIGIYVARPLDIVVATPAVKAAEPAAKPATPAVAAAQP